MARLCAPSDAALVRAEHFPGAVLGGPWQPPALPAPEALPLPGHSSGFFPASASRRLSHRASDAGPGGGTAGSGLGAPGSRSRAPGIAAGPAERVPALPRWPGARGAAPRRSRRLAFVSAAAGMAERDRGSPRGPETRHRGWGRLLVPHPAELRTPQSCSAHAGRCSHVSAATAALAHASGLACPAAAPPPLPHGVSQAMSGGRRGGGSPAACF